jgi:adenylyl cyclase-associated protein
MDNDFFTVIKPMQEACGEVGSIKEANRGKPTYDHLSTVAESIEVIGWFGSEAKPHKQIEEGVGSAQYWGNRILKKYKTE